MSDSPADGEPTGRTRRGRRAAEPHADARGEAGRGLPAEAAQDASPWWARPGGASMWVPSAVRGAGADDDDAATGWVPTAPDGPAVAAPLAAPVPAAPAPVAAAVGGDAPDPAPDPTPEATPEPAGPGTGTVRPDDTAPTSVLPVARTRRELRELEARRRRRGTGAPDPAPEPVPDPAAAASTLAGAPAGAAAVTAPEAPARRAGRAGRNLPAAIAVGVLLGGLVVASLFTRKEAFVAVVAVAAVLGVRELAGAFAGRHLAVPVVPLAVGAVGMLVSAYVAGEEGLLVSFVLTAFGVLLWRIIDGMRGAVRDVVAAVFAAAYVPLLAGFAILMLAEDDGPLRIVVFITTTVASDIGGYAAGVLFGRHPMAPTISPKKSWEGFGGSALACLGVGIAGVTLLLGGPWWAGAAVGAATVVTATLGDLSESLLKRDLGIKDMGAILPGHGGFMDRLDSLLPTAPVVFLLLATLVPVV